MRRSWAIAATLVALIVLNLWRWWPAQAGAQRHAEARQVLPTAQKLRLAVRTSMDGAAPPAARNIFRLREPLPPPAKVPDTPPPASTLPAAEFRPPEPPPKTPEEREAEVARAELAQIKVVGVIFRDATGHAYLARGDETYMVSLGDSVARFTVTAITPESVRLHDTHTQVGALVPVMGK